MAAVASPGDFIRTTPAGARGIFGVPRDRVRFHLRIVEKRNTIAPAKDGGGTIASVVVIFFLPTEKNGCVPFDLPAVKKNYLDHSSAPVRTSF